MKKRMIAFIMGLLLMVSQIPADLLATESRAAEAPGGQPPEMLSENMQSPDGQPPEKPEGENGQSPDGQPPEKPDGENGQSPDGQPPEKPDGENGQSPDGQLPEKPDGENGQSPDGQPPEKPDGEDMPSPDGQPPEIPDGKAAPGMGGQPPEMPGGGAPDLSGYSAVLSLDESSEDTERTDEAITSTGTDENAVRISGDITATLDGVTIDRSSGDSTGGDNASFYGIGAAVLATDGVTEISGSTITTDASGGTGIFAYGDAVVHVADTEITTQQDTSGAIHAAGGGTLYAANVTAETNGRSAAAIRSDRGGGTMVVDGGSYTSNGADSPAVYCTAGISVRDADLRSNGSEAVCIEGLNSLRLYNCNLSGNMSDDERNDNTWTVIVYQSMSGDSEVGNGTFQMDGGTLTSGNGGLFYTTNTECTITLKDVTIESASDSEFFLQCTGNNNTRGWGQSGANGADCLFTAIGQEMRGDVLWDSISSLDFYMTQGSVFTGAFLDDETYTADDGDAGNGYCNVIIDEDSQWVVTGDSRVSSLSCSGILTDEEGKTVTVQTPDGTVLSQGESDYTITADVYDTDADVSGCASVEAWEG